MGMIHSLCATCDQSQQPERRHHRMNTITKLIWAILAGIVLLWVGGGTPADATGVHHPECPAGWTRIVDQPPHSGLSVTAAYSGTMWIKISTQHVEVPVVSKGDVVTPHTVSSWPTNKKGKFQEVSHVDYCIPPVTETTAPQTTIPETTVPETTVPETTTPETTIPETTAPETTVPEECVPEGSKITDVDTGKTYIYGTPTEVGYDTCGNPIPDICVEWEPDQFTTLWSVTPCGPPATTTPTPGTTVPTRLPDTGPTGVLEVALGAMMIMSLGGAALWVARR